MSGDVKKPGLDLSKLLAKAKPSAAPDAPTEVAPKPASVTADVAAKVTQSPAAPKAPPSKPIGVGGQARVGQVGTLGGVAKSSSPLAAPTAKAEPAKALVAAAPINRKIEAIASRQGAKADKLNVVQREERKYPYACFGVDELYVFAETMFNTIRAHVWKVKSEFPTFTIGLRYIGSIRKECSVTWTGEKFETDWEKIPEKYDALATVDADLAIDYVRGVMSCVATEFADGLVLDDPQALLWKLRVMRWKYDNESLSDKLKEVDGGLQERKKALRDASKNAIDFLCKYTSMKVEKAADWIVEPLFLRFIVEGDQPTEILFHFQKGQFTVLQGKPGETLAPGVVDVTVSKRGLQAMWDRECQFHFAFLSGLFRATGELDMLRKFQICNTETVRRIRAYNQSQKPSSQAEPLLLDVKATVI
jgi:hypothetical protein